MIIIWIIIINLILVAGVMYYILNSSVPPTQVIRTTKSITTSEPTTSEPTTSAPTPEPTTSAPTPLPKTSAPTPVPTTSASTITSFTTIRTIPVPTTTVSTTTIVPTTTLAPTTTRVPTITEIYQGIGAVEHLWNYTKVYLSKDGSTFAVGFLLNEPGSYNGTVRVWRQSNNLWSRLGQDILQGCSGISLSADGSILAIGSERNEGLVSVYKLSNNIQWTKLGNDIIGTTSNEGCGFSVSLSDDGQRIAVGCPGYINGQGITRIYQFIQDWMIIGEIVGDGGSSGFSVSLSEDGNKIAIGSPFANNGIGKTKIYQNSSINNRWNFLFEILGNTDGLKSGACVSLSSDGNRIAISQPGATIVDKIDLTYLEERFYKRGLIRIYNISGNSFTQLGNDIVGNMFDYLGASMSLAGNGSSIVIGTPFSNNLKGVTRIYKLSNNSWIKFDKDIIGENLLFVGSSVSISYNGSRIAVGNGDYETFTKSVRIYNI